MSIGLCLLILLTFSTVWIYPTLAEEEQEESHNLILTTDEGDASLVDPLVIEGFLSDPFNTTYISYKTQETTIETNRLPWYQHFDSTGDPKLDRYLVDYRSFMRGKALSSSFYAESEEHLIYLAQPSDVYWNVFNDRELHLSLLNKDTQEIMNYQFFIPSGDIPEETTFGVQRIIPQGSDLYVLVEGYFLHPSRSNGGDMDLYLFHIELENIQDQQELNYQYAFAHASGEPYSIQLAEDPMDTYPYVVLRTIHSEETEYGDFELFPGDYFIYHLDTQEWIEMGTHETLNYAHILHEDGNFYVLDDRGESFEVYAYDVENNTIAPLSTIDKSNPQMGSSASNYYVDTDFSEHMFLNNEQVILYDYTFAEDNYSIVNIPIQVNDINSGELLYSGKIELEEESTYTSIDLLDIYWEE
jgi:hypothetical protein